MYKLLVMDVTTPTLSIFRKVKLPGSIFFFLDLALNKSSDTGCGSVDTAKVRLNQVTVVATVVVRD